MTSTSNSHLSPARKAPTHRRHPHVSAFRAPPLRPPTALDIRRDLASVRQRRMLLSQRIAATVLRGHVRDWAA